MFLEAEQRETWPSRDHKTYYFPEVKVNKRFVYTNYQRRTKNSSWFNSGLLSSLKSAETSFSKQGLFGGMLCSASISTFLHIVFLVQQFLF